MTRFVILLSIVSMLASAGVAVLAVNWHVRHDQARALSTFMVERGTREEMDFDLVSDIQGAALTTFWQFYDTLSDDDIETGMAAYFALQEDGTRRSKDNLFNGTFLDGIGPVDGIGAFMSAAHDFTPERERIFYAAFLTIARHGAAMAGELESLWFFTPTDDLIIYAPKRHDRLIFYRREAPPFFAISGFPLSDTSSFANNPDGITRCTPLTTLAYDTSGESLTTGCQTPARRDGVQIGVMGNTMPLSNAFREAYTNLPSEDAELVFLTSDGELIMHPEFLDGPSVSRRELAEITESVGPEALMKTIREDGLEHGVTFAEPTAFMTDIVAYYHLTIPDWYVVIVVPKSTLLINSIEQVLPSVILLLFIGVLTIAVLAHYVRRFAIRPMRALADQFRQPGDPGFKFRTSLEQMGARKDEIGRLARVLVGYRERTDAHVTDLEDKVKERTADLQAVSEAKSNFLATMSHELRTPMNGIMGVAGALKRTSVTPEQTEMIELIQRSSALLERQLTDALDISKVEAGKLALEKTATDVAGLVEAVCKFYRPSADEKPITLTSHISPECDGFFLVDDVRIRQVLSNLVNNAIKFTARGSIEVTVSGGVVRDGIETLHFEVKDTGSGLSENELATVFEPFSQVGVSGPRRDINGTGLGLTICRSLVQLHGGAIGASSEPGSGSCFYFTLPLVRCKTHLRAEAENGLEISDTALTPLHNLRVLIAEDHPMNQRVLQLILRPFGCQVDCVENGMEAVETFSDDPHDIIFMDSIMPEMDGLEATRRIRAFEAENGLPRAALLMVSANAAAEFQKDAMEAGADECVSKPVTPARILTAVQSVLSRQSEPDRASARSSNGN